MDLHYLRELHGKGFDVDYTESLDELTWERVRQYHVAVLSTSPDAFDVLQRGKPSSSEKVEAFVRLFERFVGEGGGVLLFPSVSNYCVGWPKQELSDLTERWGANIPLLGILENASDNVSRLTHAPVRLAFTDAIMPSPITTGVRGIWFPNENGSCGVMTGPIVVDSNWQVLVRTSKTAQTTPLDLSKLVVPPITPSAPPDAEHEPALVAIRELAIGRVALVNQWRQFTFGAGTRWTYNREIIDRVVAGKPSDFGRLFENMLRWLAEPALQHGELGGYIMSPDRLLAPNEREEVLQQYREVPFPYDAAALGKVSIPSTLRTYRGVIGAQTAYGAGSGSVDDYARAARDAKLDFLVFLDRFDRLTPARLAALQADCKRLSASDLLLLPGFTIESNIGDHMFFFAPQTAWPPEHVLTGPPDRRHLYLQEEDGQGGYTGYGTPYSNWVLSSYHVSKGQVGFYDLKGSPHGMRLHDARLYAMVGLRFYRGAKLVEDLLGEYLTTVQSTISPTPVVIDELMDPAELTRTVRSTHSLTYAQAESLDASAPRGIFHGALRWSHQYDSLPVFTSSGPQILAWPGTHRVSTYGGEGFAPGRAVMPSPLAVVAEKGLRELRIYDGRRLFRRFRLNGQRRFEQTLVLDAAVQRNLVLVAEDQAGGVAVSAARRAWSDATLAPAFCSDHINDCGPQFLLAHGPYQVPLNHVTPLAIDVAGVTWDGGPSGIRPVVETDTSPRLDSNLGAADAARAGQIPWLDFSDEGAVSIASERRQLYDARLARVVNPWHTFGPLGEPISLFSHVNRYRQYVAPSLGAPESDWAAMGLRTGVSASLFTDTLTFKRDLVVKSLRLATLRRTPNTVLVVGAGGDVATFDLAGAGPSSVRVAPGDWFALFAKGLGNAQLFVNRAAPIRIVIGPRLELDADLDAGPMRAGKHYDFELAGFGFPLDQPIDGAAAFAAYVDYLRQPQGLRITRGARVESPGMLEVAAEDGAVEISLPHADAVSGLSLPLRISGLNPRWSAGLLQKSGYTKGFYGSGENRWRALGVEDAGFAYVPLHVDRADLTSISAGQPVVAGPSGRELFIQVTNLGGAPPRWHVAVNNPTDREVRTVLRNAMHMRGISFQERALRIAAGGYVVVQ